jgi:putative endonuclease
MVGYVYIVECLTSKYYTGETNCIERRMQQHQTGIGGAKFVKANGYKDVVMIVETRNKTDAKRLEAKIKTLNRTQKQELILENIQKTVEIKEKFSI